MSNFIFSDEEFSLISNTFGGNEGEEIIHSLKKLFYQGELLQADLANLKKLTPEAKDLVSKVFLPKLKADAPLNQSVDLWISINTKEKDPEEAYLEMRARQIVVDYLAERLKELKGEDFSKDALINLSDLVFKPNKDVEKAFIEMSARNTIIQHIDLHLQHLKIIAGEGKETPEKIKERLAKNSNK